MFWDVDGRQTKMKMLECRMARRRCAWGLVTEYSVGGVVSILWRCLPSDNIPSAIIVYRMRRKIIRIPHQECCAPGPLLGGFTPRSLSSRRQFLNPSWSIILFGRVALVEQPSIVVKLSRGRSVGLCVGRCVRASVSSVHCEKNGGSDPDADWHHRSDGSRDEAVSGVWG